MSGGFVKIYGSILRSSVWQTPLATKVTWITMLALADENGLVEASIPGLAATAGVTLEECETALACFLAPDRYSGSDVDEGRRIRPCRGGWVVINHAYYREMRTERQIREAERIADKRAQTKASAGCNTRATAQHVANVAGVALDAEADTEIRISSDSPSATPDAHPSPDASSGPEVSAKAETSRAVKVVFECWQAEHGKQRSKLDGKRTTRIRARLAEGFTVDQLCQAIRGAKKDPFLMGRDPRAGRVFDGIETILRDAAQVERLIALEEGKGAARKSKPDPDLGSEEAWARS
jgi:hypothetical protein